jgi:dihydroneopterin aldolase
VDIIFIRGLRIATIIGINDWEQHIKQTVIIDLELGADIGKAAATDRIENTLNYKAITKQVVKFVSESRFQLVETLADQVAKLLLKEFPILWLRLTLNKPGALRDARDVGVIIERQTAR